MTRVTCYLMHLTQRSKLYLPHKELFTLGRNIETQIEDLYVSKKQIECIADTEKCIVQVKPVGKSVSGIDGYAVVKDKTYRLGPGHIIEVRLGFHPYEIMFECLDEINYKPPTKKLRNTFHVETVTSLTSDSGQWEAIDNKELLIYSSAKITSKHKIAAFDMDGTVIKTKSGKRFPKDADDWTLNYDYIPHKFSQLIKDGFKIVFFTNQSGVGKDPSKINDIKRKIENVINKIAVPIQVYVALGKTFYRKPMTGMWQMLNNKKNDNVEIDLINSFYVGDAAGRDKNWSPKKPKDHSTADRLFALNIGLKFYTPEEYFLKQKPAPFIMPEFDPRVLDLNIKYPDIKYDSLTLVLMVGGPGSGKSQFCKSILVPKGYVHINRDKLGSWQKCVKLLEECIKENKNCVVDNTNCDKDSRKRYLEVAARFKIPCRCFMMTTSYQQSKHNNKFRELTDKSHVPVNEFIINNLKKSYQAPELSEGFDEIVEIPFVPNFQNEQDEILYKMFLLEK